MSLDLEKQLTFYGAYHHHSVNVAIHMICVPLILVSGFSLASFTGTLIQTPSWVTLPHLDLNLGTIAAFLYASLYVLLEPVAGTVLGLFCLGSAAAANAYRLRDPGTTLQVSLAVHVVCWIAQFVGHGVFEGRSPALFDNLVQALFLAPMFVWLEFLFKLGYRRELQARVDKSVQDELAKFRAQTKNGKAH